MHSYRRERRSAYLDVLRCILECDRPFVKHVFIFGALSQLPVDSNNRPEDPPRIIKTETVLPYFDDIVVRETAKKAVKVEPKRKRKVKGTKNFSLMSFGDEVRGRSFNAPLCTFVLWMPP